MPTLEENKSRWDGTYDWHNAGEEWSSGWGTSSMQWYGTILPRIRAFLPAQTILEIAPGFGRWTEFLKNFCTQLLVVDISAKCIQGCQERFAGWRHITYFVNNGESLDMIPENAIDLIFSFDSLVHAEDTVISSYVSQLASKLNQNGVAFLHHSNMGAYSTYLNMQNTIAKIPKLRGLLLRLGALDDIGRHWRAPTMTARKMELYAEKSGLQCISQELVTWGTRRILLDCFSTIVKKNSIWCRDNKVFRNPFFVKEARNLANLSQLYDFEPRK
jgi:2-polyprenyl-3-methyl-5-hydroxy-6-metoxy-1,4-benzoquinol methylase